MDSGCGVMKGECPLLCKYPQHVLSLLLMEHEHGQTLVSFSQPYMLRALWLAVCMLIDSRHERSAGSCRSEPCQDPFTL